MSAELAVKNCIDPPAGLDLTDRTLTPWLDRNVPISDVLYHYEQTRIHVASRDALLARDRHHLQAVAAIIDARMRDNAATKAIVAMEDGAMVVAEMVTAPPETEKRIDVLRELLDLKNGDGDPLIPDAELRKAIWVEQPAPVWKTHLTHLRKLAAYGKAAQDVLLRGIVEQRTLPRLKMTRVEPEPAEPINVTGSAS
jgi:hypothetical protein